MKLVIDSSVVIKWFIDEEGKEKALNILNNILDCKLTAAIPRIIYFETGNVLLSNKISSEEKVRKFKIILEKTLTDMYDFDYADWPQIIKLAGSYSLSFYDCCYVYLAKKLNTYLITADKKLFEKTKKSGLVRLL